MSNKLLPQYYKSELYKPSSNPGDRILYNHPIQKKRTQKQHILIHDAFQRFACDVLLQYKAIIYLQKIRQVTLKGSWTAKISSLIS